MLHNLEAGSRAGRKTNAGSTSPHLWGEARRQPATMATSKRAPTACTATGTSGSRLPAWDLAPVTIVGAGIAGLATAVALNKAGIPSRILESSSSLRSEGTAIGLWDNAWRALEALGVADAIRPSYLPLDRVELCRGEAPGRLLRAFSFKECEGGVGSEFRGVHRGALLEALANALPADAITFECKVDRINDSSEQAGGAPAGLTVQLSKAGTSGSTALECGVLVGADGTRSATAKHLGLPEPNYAGYVAYRGLAKLGPGGLQAVGLPRNTIRQVWGAGKRAGLYPLSDDEVYWFLTFNASKDAKIPASPELMVAEARSLLSGWGWSLDKVIAATNLETFNRSRIADRWNPGPWGRGLVTLAGDAAHPMTPNLGQGGCTALEDAVVLAAQLTAASGGGSGAEARTKVQAALRRYEQQRAQRCVPLTVRANLMGQVLQLHSAPVCLARDLFVGSPLFSPSHFLDHSNWDVRQAVMNA